MTQPELDALARSILDTNRFMALGTADSTGLPWVSPVWYAPDGYRTLYWASSPETRHSQNLTSRPELAIVVFDSHRVGAWSALYMSAVGEEVEDVDAAIAVYTRRSEAQGFRPWTRDDVLPPARHRLYRATVSDHFVLDDHDRRLPVQIE